MKTFVDFIQSPSSQDPTFLETVQTNDTKILRLWFQDIGYEVSEEECKKIMDGHGKRLAKKGNNLEIVSTY